MKQESTKRPYYNRFLMWAVVNKLENVFECYNYIVYNPLCMCAPPLFVPAYSVNSFPSRWQAELSLSRTALVRQDLNSFVVWLGFHSFSRFPFLTVALCFLLQIHLIICLSSSRTVNVSISLSMLFIFSTHIFLYISTFPVSASRIFGMQIWICKCYVKHRSRCVTARTESGQHGRTDMPCMQVKLLYNMAPRGHRKRARSFNGWIPDSLPGASWKDHTCQSVRATADKKTMLPMRGYIHSYLSKFQFPRQLDRPNCMAMK